MSQEYRIIIQQKSDNGKYETKSIVKQGKIKKPSSILELGLRHIDQIKILQKIQDNILDMQSVDLQEDIAVCPICGNKIVRHGVTKSSFNSVFTDHKIAVHRLICKKCNWRSVPSIKALFGTHMHPDLLKLQCETGAKHTYKNAQDILNQKSCGKRSVNNTMTVRSTVETIGNYISENPATDIIKPVESAKELVIQGDGGHIKSKSKGERSFEALTTVVYRPENIICPKKKGNKEEKKEKEESKKRGKIISKHCAGSALDDQNKQIKKLTLVAAKKQGLTKNTTIIALCDGAKNCWDIIDAIEPHCSNITRILDWFHIAVKFKNISLAEKHQELLDHIKWNVWHNKVETALFKLKELTKLIRSNKNREKLNKLYKYLFGNSDKLVNYGERKKHKLIFTSQAAESTVESLINQRCKGKQHMQWTREGVHPILQIRAAVASNDWITNWEPCIMGAYAKAA